MQYVVLTLAASSMAGMWQSMEAPEHIMVQKKQPMKETMDRMSEVVPFERMSLCMQSGKAYNCQNMQCSVATAIVSKQRKLRVCAT